MALFKKTTKEEKKDEAVVTASTETKKTGLNLAESVDWVLLKPRITEKSAVLMEGNKYTFNIHKDANRSQVKKAIKSAYKVNPIKINLVIRDGRMKRRRGRMVMDRGYKKAIVTLAKGDSIELL